MQTIWERLTFYRAQRGLLPLVLCAYWLRIFRLGFQELRGDEAFSYVAARGTLGDIFRLLIEQGEPHPPLHFLLMHGSLQLTGPSEFSLRYVGVLVSVLAIPSAYWIGRKLLTDRRSALLLTGLVAINPLQIWAAQDARHQYALVAGFSTVATAAFLFALARRSRFGWVLYGAVALLTMYSHYYGVFPLAAHGVYLTVAVWRHEEPLAMLRHWLLAGFAAAALFAPWLYLHAPGLARRIDEASNPLLSDHVIGVWHELLLGSTIGPAFIPLLLIALLLVVLGSGWMLQRRPAWAIALLFWLLSTTLVLYGVRLNRALFNNFYIIPASIPWLILMLAGSVFLYHRFGRTASFIPSVLVLMATAVSLGNYYFSAEYSKSWGYRSVAAYLDAEATANDALVAHFPDPNFDYYFRDIVAFRTLAPPRVGMTPDEIGAYMADLAKQYEKVWFVPAHKSSWDPANAAFEWLDFETVRVHERDHMRLTLLAYRPLSHISSVATPIGRQLRDELVLQAAFVTVAGEAVDLSQPLQVGPSQRIRVNLQWQSLRQLDTSYTMFVHLLGDDGQLLAQHDGIPVRGSRPTNYWAADSTYWDLHELFLPETILVEGGTLLIGLYTTDTIERQSFDDGVDSWPLAKIVVRP